MITPEREIQLSKLIKSGNQKAQNELIEANLRFVISVAKQYSGRGIPVEDLVNEGNIGLIKAAQKWDETRGIKFISYAVWWIRQSIIQSLSDNSRQIRIPVNQINNLNKINSLQSELEQQLQRTPTIEELSEYLNLDSDKIELVVLANKKVQSLDTPIDDDGFVLSDTISGDFSTDVLVLKSDLSNQLNLAIDKLDKKEQLVIKSSFGLLGEELTVTELSNQLGVCPERVRQIKKKALKKLRSII
jgi:RNA polymerase primary sigma factor